MQRLLSVVNVVWWFSLVQRLLLRMCEPSRASNAWSPLGKVGKFKNKTEQQETKHSNAWSLSV